MTTPKMLEHKCESMHYQVHSESMTADETMPVEITGTVFIPGHSNKDESASTSIDTSNLFSSSDTTHPVEQLLSDLKVYFSFMCPYLKGKVSQRKAKQKKGQIT